MAEEITTSVAFAVVDAARGVKYNESESYKEDWSGAFDGGSQVITEGAHQAIAFKSSVDIAPFKFTIKNLESGQTTADPYIQYGIDVGGVFYPLGELFGQAYDCLHLAHVDVYCKAYNGDVEIKFAIFENVR